MEKPDKVAEVQVCYDARSVEVSKYEGFEDKYAVVGCYWPPHFVILDGATLEPFKIVSTRSYTYDTEEYHPEPRVASIVASQARPQWVINVKETGQVWLVDYSDPNNPTIKMLEAELFLHDGGWALAWEGTEPRGPSPYFLVAANMKNKIVVVDTVEEEIEAIIETGNKPHPGRGANWVHPEYGPVWATVHLGEGKASVIGADPEGHPQYAWKVVKDIELPGGGSLFIKTHPKSRWIWVDFTVQQAGHPGVGERLGPQGRPGQRGRDRHLRRQDPGGGGPHQGRDRHPHGQVQRLQHDEGHLLMLMPTGADGAAALTPSACHRAVTPLRYDPPEGPGWR